MEQQGPGKALEFRLLGPLEVARDGGEPLDLGGRRRGALLSLLLLRANQVVSTDFIVDSIWGESPPRTATSALHNVVVSLRKLLGAEMLVTRAPGYRLVVDPESIDLCRFERLVADARTLDGEERADRLREALSLWRGSPLPEFAYEAFAAQEILRLEELHLATLEDCFDADLACGRHADIVPELEAHVARDPLRERPREQLMLALYHSGRRADALRAYQDVRRALAEEGLDPGPRLQELNTQILREEVPRPRQKESVADDTHFEAVAAALGSGRLVPVLGVDGAALAAALARRFDVTEDAQDLTRVAQFVALTRGPGPLYDELESLLRSSAAPTPLHRFFAALPRILRERGLPHQLLVTTSYDLSLEQALLEAEEQFDVVSYLAAGRDRGRFCHRAPSGEAQVIDVPNTYATELSLERRTIVLKLHGGLQLEESPTDDSFVVTEDDYIGYLARGDIGTAIPVALTARLRRSHFLFLGYGMRQWSLRLVLDRVCGSEALAYRSWAVVPEARPLERHLWRSRDVELLEHPLDEYVRVLGRHVGIETAEATA